jgi:hypothetical protein
MNAHIFCRHIGKIYCIAFFLITSSFNAQVGIGTTTPNSNSLLDIDATVTSGGLLLPRIGLTSTSSFSPLTAHVQGMTIYNTTTNADVFPGIYTNHGSRWVRVEDSSPTANSVSLANDLEISSGTFTNVPGMVLTFTARKSSVLILLTASGFGYTNSMSYVQLRVRNITAGNTIGGTNTKIQSYDDVTGTITPWSASFSKVLTGLTVGTNYTLRVQGAVGGILGVNNAAIQPISNPDSHHITLSVMQ